MDGFQFPPTARDRWFLSWPVRNRRLGVGWMMGIRYPVGPATMLLRGNRRAGSLRSWKSAAEIPAFPRPVPIGRRESKGRRKSMRGWAAPSAHFYRQPGSRAYAPYCSCSIIQHDWVGDKSSARERATNHKGPLQWGLASAQSRWPEAAEHGEMILHESSRDHGCSPPAGRPNQTAAPGLFWRTASR